MTDRPTLSAAHAAWKAAEAAAQAAPVTSRQRADLWAKADAALDHLINLAKQMAPAGALQRQTVTEWVEAQLLQPQPVHQGEK